MYELSIALKYLKPKWRSLSVSIISLISIFVIALVVWLIIVFFSVTMGLEKSWTQKLVAVTSPIRITPTEEYYRSYYYLVDGISAESGYSLKTIGEKRLAGNIDPYNPAIDAEIPQAWPKADKDLYGNLKNPVALAFSAIDSIKKPLLFASEFEAAAANMSFKILKQTEEGKEPSFATYSVYLGSLDPRNVSFEKNILPLSVNDINNLLYRDIPSDKVKDNVFSILDHLVEKKFKQHHTGPHFSKRSPLNGLLVEQAVPQVVFESLPKRPPPWVHVFSGAEGKRLILPQDLKGSEGVILPKSFKEIGLLVGDFAELSYSGFGLSAVQEHRIPIYIAGFYDPGIIPIGGKLAIVNPGVISTIRSSQGEQASLAASGINVRFDDLTEAENVKKTLQDAFEKAGISSYWKIDSFKDFEFAKDLLQQLKSEKHLWMLIASVIIVVACSNIVSMLVILVNDKKQEIGILRSMGASTFSVAFIFGFCGIVMGMLGSFVGAALAILTLNNLSSLVELIGRIQGHDMFNPLFYGGSLPNELSVEAVLFVVAATALISFIAGIIPAMKACTLKPSSILRAE